MILNQKQYTATKGKLKMLEDSLTAPRREGVPDVLAEAALAQTRELMGEMQSEIDEYERAIKADPARIPVHSLDDLLVAPIRYRLACRLSTEAFARRARVSVRQIYRYEQERYENCSIETLKRICSNLNLTLEGSLQLADNAARGRIAEFDAG